MGLRVSDQIPLSLHHQVYLILRQEILEGRYETGKPMPGDLELSARFGASRITIRRALDRLRAENLVVRRRGAGTFAQPAAEPSAVDAGLETRRAAVVVPGAETSIGLVSLDYVGAPPEIAARMNVAPRTPVQKTIRTRSYRKQPFCHITGWVPAEIGRRFDETALTSKPILSLLEDDGIKVRRIEQSFSAKLADSATAPLLKVELGSPLLWVARLVFDESDQVVELIDTLYPPELYSYQVDLRWQSQGWTENVRGPHLF